ncbi:MAG: HNH endonuclease signature motif containing protein [Verrucomicrobiota bacterium]
MNTTDAMPFPKTATCVPKMSGMGACYCGRRGMPRQWIDLMYADYQSGLSLVEVAAKHDRTRQALFDIFKRRGLKLRAKKFNPQLVYRGRKYTLDSNDYYRDTIYRSGKYTAETFLHRRIWSDHNGPIPAGHTVCFKDGDRKNCTIENLELLSHDEQQQRRGTGANQFTKVAKQKLGLMLSSHQSGRRSTLAVLAGGGR